jgi:transcriptional antiterminator RfaH
MTHGMLEPYSPGALSEGDALSRLRQGECGSHSGAWYCVQSKPKREREVADRLDAQGFGSFLPLVAVRRRGVVEEAPAFPGYLFVRFSLLADRWRSIYSTLGVRRLFSADEQPIPVPDSAISTLLRLGYDRPIAAPDLPEAIAPGSRVRIACGPFAGLDGVCQWSDAARVGLLLEIMGARRLVRIPRDAAGAA